ncbi:MAG: PIN domain nuclease [Gloeomargaritaceae cyanobacterium C42_A2020_066]|nr:PIN domain nuclease [Gloeomargaritaceae cyanobacterium C42_A2020_066]
MILVDSSVWVDYFNGVRSRETDFLDSTLGIEPVAIGDLILTEVLQGFRSDSDYQTAKSLLLELTVFELLGQDLAVKAADNYRVLRRCGVTVRKTVDCIIATFCIERGLPLLYTDRDFEPFAKSLGLVSALPAT